MRTFQCLIRTRRQLHSNSLGRTDSGWFLIELKLKLNRTYSNSSWIPIISWCLPRTTLENQVSVNQICLHLYSFCILWRSSQVSKTLLRKYDEKITAYFSKWTVKLLHKYELIADKEFEAVDSSDKSICCDVIHTEKFYSENKIISK